MVKLTKLREEDLAETRRLSPSTPLASGEKWRTQQRKLWVKRGTKCVVFCKQKKDGMSRRRE